MLERVPEAEECDLACLSTILGQYGEEKEELVFQRLQDRFTY